MTKVESTGTNKVKIEITVSPEDFSSALQQAYNKKKGQFNVQGFRNGKAPRRVIENYYGEGIFYEDAFEIAFPDSYTAAVDAEGIVPVSRPDIDVKTIGQDEGIVYTAEVFVKPEVKLGEYKGVKAEKPKAEVTDQQADDEIAKEAEKNVRWVDVDRAAQDKDKVVIDYSGSLDGEKFDGGTAENQPLELGSNTFIPGFEEQVVGMKKEEERDITVKFPEGYQAEHLAGKDVVFHIKLNEVKEKEMPTIDDEFAQDVSEFDTLDEYKASIKEKLLKQAEEKASSETKNNVLEKVVENAEIDLPECMIENQIDNQIQQIQYSMMYQGIKLEDYLKMTGMTMEQLRGDYRDQAEKTVRIQLVLEAVKEQEGIEASDEQVEEELKKRAESYKKDLEEYRKAVGDDEMAYIRDNIAYDNTVSFLVDNAQLHAPKKKTKKDKAEKENKTAE